MNINITSETCHRIAENPNQTELERMLANYAIRLKARIGKVENDNAELKNILKSISAKIFSNAPYILEQEAKNHAYTVTAANKAAKFEINETSNTQEFDYAK